MNAMPRRHQKKAMTRKGNFTAAFATVTDGVLDKLDAGMIARGTGVAVAEVQRMIDERRVREAGNELG